MADSNRRRGARIATSVSFEIVGAGSAPALRRGDISSSGVFVQGDPEAGAVGTVRHLRLGLPGADELTEVLGRVVRRVLVEDLRGTSVIGVAFEFLFTEDDSRRHIAQLVEDVAKRKRSDSGRQFAIEHAFDAEVGNPDDSARHDATVYVVGMDKLSLETGWPAKTGEVIECVVRAPTSNQEFAFSGSVVSAEPLGAGDRYRVDIRFASDRPVAEPVVSGESIERAINILLEESIRPRDYARAQGSSADMRGNTRSLPLHSLLTLAEMEGLTGVLTLEVDGGAGTVFLREGRVVDVELSTGADDPRDALLAMIEWADADFEYSSGDVDREDRLDAETGVLLLEMARDRDERKGD